MDLLAFDHNAYKFLTYGIYIVLVLSFFVYSLLLT